MYNPQSNYNNQNNQNNHNQSNGNGNQRKRNLRSRSENISPQRHNVNSRKIASPERKKSKTKTFVEKIFKKSDTIKLVRYREGVDRIFLLLVIVLLSFGTVMVFSASYANALWRYGDTYFFAKKQLMMAGIGIVGMIITTYLADYRLIKKLAVPFFIFILALNYITPFFGKIVNGTPRWFVIFGVQIQPSEFLKLAVVFFFAYYIVKIGDKMKTFTWGIAIPIGIVLAVAGAMFLQSHFSGLIIIALICICMIFIGEAPIKWLAGFSVAGALGLLYVILYTGYTSDRIQAWLDPFNPEYQGEESWQTIQSLYAIGSGGLLGVGIGQSKQKYLYLPEPQNDFIFSIVCEELGFIGALIIIALFVLLIWRGFVIAYHAPDKFSSLVVSGIVLKVAIQFILNIAVVTNSIPTTGISLPFFSYGGTALIVLLVEMGIILSISRYSYQEKT